MTFRRALLALIHHKTALDFGLRNASLCVNTNRRRGTTDKTIGTKLQVTERTAPQPNRRFVCGEGSEKPCVGTTVMAQRQQHELEPGGLVGIWHQFACAPGHAHRFVGDNGEQLANLGARGG